MEARSLMIAAGSMVVAMILATAWIGDDLTASSTNGGQQAEPGSQVQAAPLQPGDQPAAVDPATGQPVTTTPAPTGEGTPEDPAVIGQGQAAGAVTASTAALSGAEATVRSCVAAAGTWGECTEALPQGVNLVSVSEADMTVSDSTNTYYLRIYADSACRFTQADPQNCEAW